MDSPQSDLSSLWARLSANLGRELEPSSGQLTIGKQGVYLIEREEKVTSFQLVPWQQVLSDDPFGNRKPVEGGNPL